MSAEKTVRLKSIPFFKMALFLFAMSLVACENADEKKKSLAADNLAIQKAQELYAAHPDDGEEHWPDNNSLPLGYNLQRFGVEDGLLNNKITAVAQDSLGCLWIKSDLGLTKYDGKQLVNFKPEITSFSLPTDLLIITPQGEICYPIMGGEITFQKNKFNFHNADSLMMEFHDPESDKVIGYSPFGLMDRWGNDWYFSKSLFFVSPAGKRKSAESFRFEHSKKGAHACIHFVDGDGNLWIETQNGLYFYNGKSFDSIPVDIHGKNITQAFVDKRKSFWLKTFDDTLFHFSAYGETAKFVLPPQNDYAAIGEDAYGKVYVSNSDCVSEFSANDVQENNLPLRHVKKMISTHDGILICISDSVCSVVLNGQFFSVATEHELNGTINTCFVDRENNIWLCTTNGLYRCSKTAIGKVNLNTAAIAQFFHKEEGDSVKDANGKKQFEKHGNSNYSILLLDSKGRIWAKCFLGLILFTPLDSQTPYVLFPEIPLSNTDIEIVEDGKERIWIGIAQGKTIGRVLASTGKGGLWCYSENKLQRISVDRGTGVRETDFAVGDLKTLYGKKQSIFIDSKNRCWSITSLGVVLANEKGATVVSGEEISHPSLLEESFDGKLILASQGCISQYDEPKGKFIPICKNAGLAFEYSPVMTVDHQGRVWFGKLGADYLFVASAHDQLDSIPLKQLGLADAQHLFNNVNFLATDRMGNIWISSSPIGLTFIVPGKNKLIEQLKHFTLADGLSSNEISGACFDKHNHLYVQNDFGIDQLSIFYANAKMLHRYAISSLLYNLDYANGKECQIKINDTAVLDIWTKSVGQMEGLNEPSPGALKICSNGQDLLVGETPTYCIKEISLTIPKLPITSITNLSVRGETINTNFTTLPVHAAFDYSNNNIGFSFMGVSLTAPEKVRYRFLLDGYDEAWSSPTDQNFSSYTNLPEGKYTFSVIACNGAGNYSLPTSYSFVVLPPWYRTWWAYTLFVLTGFGIVFSIFRIRTRQLRKDKERLEEQVSHRTLELVQQKHLVEEKNKEILDSITYAKRLQNAILPPLKLIKETLPQSFLLYLPKDIVAGDFYWMEKKGDLVLFSVADCTGHGVPGAMVSVVCANALNRAVNEFHLTDPGKILDKTREFVVDTYSKSEEDVKDGMDISFACLNLKTGELKWSGANNPAWIVREGNLIELAADRQPVGKSDNAKSFTTHFLQVQQGDMLYLSSDGFADQFGGIKNKKYKTTNLKKLLVEVAEKSLEEQERLIHESFLEWKGSVEQVDDVCVMGVRI